MSPTGPARRARILLTAERLLRQHGWQGTTVQDIAREARVAVGSVYLEFANKDAVVEAVSAGRYASVLQAMAEAGTRPGLAWAARLRLALDVRVEMLLALGDDGAHARDLVACACDGVKVAHRRFRDQEHAVLVRLLSDAHRDGEFHVEDPVRTAQALLRAYASFTPPWLYQEPADRIREALDALHALVLDGLVRRRGRSR